MTGAVRCGAAGCLRAARQIETASAAAGAACRRRPFLWRADSAEDQGPGGRIGPGRAGPRPRRRRAGVCGKPGRHPPSVGRARNARADGRAPAHRPVVRRVARRRLVRRTCAPRATTLPARRGRDSPTPPSESPTPPSRGAGEGDATPLPGGERGAEMLFVSPDPAAPSRFLRGRGGVGGSWTLRTHTHASARARAHTHTHTTAGRGRRRSWCYPCTCRRKSSWRGSRASRPCSRACQPGTGLHPLR
jgi:hypothetical protein